MEDVGSDIEDSISTDVRRAQCKNGVGHKSTQVQTRFGSCRHPKAAARDAEEVRSDWPRTDPRKLKVDRKASRALRV